MGIPRGPCVFLAVIALNSASRGAASCSWQQLTNAARELGAVVHDGLAVEGSPRGLVTKVPVPKGQELLFVPTALMLIDASSPPVSIWGRAAEEEGVGLDHALLRLAALLLEQRQALQDGTASGERKEWLAAWLSCLPSPDELQETDWSAAYFGPKQLAAMEVSQAASVARSVKWALSVLLEGGVWGGKPVSEREARWALHLVLSRKLAIEGSEGKPLRVVPILIDLANHVTEAEATVRVSCQGPTAERSGCVLLATRDLVAGEELRFSYAEVGDAMMMAVYGFAPPKNPVLFALPGEPAPGKVQELLQRLTCPKSLVSHGTVIFTRGTDAGIDEVTLACLRVIYYAQKDVKSQASLSHELLAVVDEHEGTGPPVDIPSLGRQLDHDFWSELQDGCEELAEGTPDAQAALRALREASDDRSRALAGALDEELEASQRCARAAAGELEALTTRSQEL